MVISVLLAVIFILLIFILIESRKEFRKKEHLKEIITIYDKSDKVIKGCTICAELPLSIKDCNNLAFVDNTFWGLGAKTGKEGDLKKILNI